MQKLSNIPTEFFDPEFWAEKCGGRGGGGEFKSSLILPAVHFCLITWKVEQRATMQGVRHMLQGGGTVEGGAEKMGRGAG